MMSRTRDDFLTFLRNPAALLHVEAWEPMSCLKSGRVGSSLVWSGIRGNWAGLPAVWRPGRFAPKIREEDRGTAQLSGGLYPSTEYTKLQSSVTCMRETPYVGRYERM